MSVRDDYTEQEWIRLARAPLLIAMAISIADPGGPLEVLKESGAALRTITEAAKQRDQGPLVTAVATDAVGRAQQRNNLLGGFRPSGAGARDQVLDELRRVEALLAAKADPRAADEFREWLRVCAQRAAMAAREGGFLGLGGERVSQREQDMLGTLGEIFGTPAE